MNEAIKDEFLNKFFKLKKEYDNNIRNTNNSRESDRIKKTFLNNKVKLFIEYMDYKEELCVALTSISSCYISGLSSNSCPISGGCDNCCSNGPMYDYLLKRINKPKKVS